MDVDEENPDYNLIVLHAYNKDFQSKLDCDTGSIFMCGLIQEIKSDHDRKCNKIRNQRFLNDIFKKVQKELHAKGKQLAVGNYNGPGLENIVFIKNNDGDRIGLDDDIKVDIGNNIRQRKLEDLELIEMNKSNESVDRLLNEVKEIVKPKSENMPMDTQENYGEVLHQFGVDMDDDDDSDIDGGAAFGYQKSHIL